MTMLGSLLGWIYRNEPALTRERLLRDERIRAANRQAWIRASGNTVQPARSVRVERIERETADTVSLYLRTEDPAPVHYRAGQFLTCCFDAEGEERRRAYSLSALPDQGHLRITVKRLADGRVSPLIHERLRVGDRFRILGPSGDFVLTPDIHHAVFIAAGAGITPIRGLVEAMLRRDGEQPVTLIYASRNVSNIIFRDELETLAATHPNLTVHHVLSRPGRTWQGLRGRLDSEQLSALLEGLDAGSRAHYFICGPDGFIELARTTLAQADVAPTRIHVERFLAAARAPRPHPTEPQTVHFLRSGKTVTVAPGQSLLEAGLAAGLPLSYSCQVGGCGHCRVKIAEGEVVSDEPNCLSPGEFRQGYRLACLSYPCDETRVDA